MLTDVEITNYRGFKKYEVEDLARVNLLVGRNGSGKTALLEGLQFLTAGGDPTPLIEAATRRGEVILSPARPEPAVMIDISHFFNSHSLAIETPFRLVAGNGTPGVTVSLVTVERPDEPKGDDRVQAKRPMLKISGGRVNRGEDRLFRITREGGVDFEPGPRLFRSRGREVPRRYDGPPVRFLSTESLEMPVLASLWDEVQLAARESEVTQALRIIESEMQSIHFLTGMFAFGYIAGRAGVVAGIASQPGRVPLGSLGEGMRRLLALAVSLVVSSQGFVFVDEIDTGLHYSVMCDMWKMVVETAKRYDIQVFATTHSWDCVAGLHALCKREPTLIEDIAVHKIDPTIDHNVAFPGEEFVRAFEGEVELR